MLELWKPVEGFEDRYNISSKGRLYSLSRSKVMKPKLDKDGYHEYALWDGKKSTYRRGHRLVAAHFIPNCKNLPVVNHKDEDKGNNCVTNLEWCSVSYNTRYSIKSKYPRSLSSLSREDFDLMVKEYRLGASYKDLVEMFNLTVKRYDTIGEVLSGRRLAEFSGIVEDIRKPYTNPAQKINEGIVVNILTDKFVEGVSQSEISKKYNISQTQVHRIVKGTRWTEVYNTFMEERLC